MSSPRIEHVKITVSDPKRTSDLMELLFDGHVRWSGPAQSRTGRVLFTRTADIVQRLQAASGSATRGGNVGLRPFAGRPRRHPSRVTLARHPSRLSPRSHPAKVQ
jgi:hypothetical protein